MEAQIQHQHGHNGDEQLPSHGLSPVMQGEGDAHDHEHHEKKSVLQNVKDKAKSKVRKIKEKLTKNGHGHEHEHDHDHDRQSYVDDDDIDDEEELVEDQEIHDAPMYKSAAARNGVEAGQQPGVNLEKPISIEEDRYKNTISGSPTKPFSQAGHGKPDHGQFSDIEHRIHGNEEDPTENPSQEYRHKNTIIDPPTRPFSEVEYAKPEHGEPTRPFSQAEHAKPDHGQFKNFKHGIDQGNPEGKVGIPSQMTEEKHDTFIDPQTRPFPHTQHAKPEHEQFKNIEHGIDRTEGNHRDQIGIPSQIEQDRYNIITNPLSRPFSQPEHEKPGHGQFRSIERGIDENQGNPRVKIGTPTRMEVDPNVPTYGQTSSNYESKVADPTNADGAEAGVTPILGSFDKIRLSDELQPIPKSDDFDSPPEIFTGTHDQFSPEPIPENALVGPKDPGSPLKALASSGEKQSSYTDKISSATSALTGKAIAAKDIVASKLGYGEKEGSEISSTGEREGSGIANTGRGEQREGSGIGNTGQSGYTEKISNATSVLTGKAIAAKDIVASKLGYGGKESSGISNTGETEGSEITNSGEKEGSGILETGKEGPTGGVTATVADYANRAAATVTGVGSSVLSKVQGGTPGENKDSSIVTEEIVENKGTSKGVISYLAEKLRPSEEDKALSEVISDTLYRKKPETEDKPVGKVTVSGELATQLGTRDDVKKENESVDAQVVGDVRPAVVERVKGWFGIGQPQSPQASHGDTNAGNDQYSSSEAGEERRLQESTN